VISDIYISQATQMWWYI